jgi:hypothetical protein
MRLGALWLIAAAGCARADLQTVSVGELGAPMDLGVAIDLAASAGDGAAPAASDGGVPSGGGAGFTPPGAADPAIAHAPPSPIAVVTLFAGLDVLDVSVDQGGGVWAVTAAMVYYLPPGRAAPFQYNQANGLARGWLTWVDTWFNPGTWPVTFSTVAGGVPGEAVIGNQGAIADRLRVDPATGAVLRLDNMQVTPANTTPAEYPEHLQRVVAAWRAVVDLNGTYDGTAYIGGFHGFYAFHGLDADCACLAFEEHQHYITTAIIAGDDVRGLAISADGDVWSGDRDFVTLLPQRSTGPRTGFFDNDFAAAIDVFPGVRDEVAALATDGAGGVYVASNVNGLAYLAPATHAPRYWSSATALPQNRTRAVAVDGKGDVWVGAAGAGLARLHPATETWIYYQQSSGLPSNDINALYWDKLSSTGKLYIATDRGVAVY